MDNIEEMFLRFKYSTILLYSSPIHKRSCDTRPMAKIVFKTS